jgi:hypothetical protein
MKTCSVFHRIPSLTPRNALVFEGKLTRRVIIIVNDKMMEQILSFKYLLSNMECNKYNDTNMKFSKF